MINRRKFFKQLGAAGLMVSQPTHFFANDKQNAKNNYLVDNPYRQVDWENCHCVPSTSHIHVDNQAMLEEAYASGLRHLPISNYYPSTPYYPPEKRRVDQFKVKQDFGVIHNMNGENRFIEGPLEWNNIIMDKESGWFDSLPDEQKAQLPFKVGGPLYTKIPEDLIFAPNAEHHSFTNTSSSTHVNSLGSFYSSGTFDAHDRFKTASHGYCYGSGKTWQDTFTEILNQLLFLDGGGITINHPTWSEMEQSQIEMLLDYDPRVLGIEVLEAGKWSVDIWDKVLRTGRRCLGFFVPDWTMGQGYNMLLVKKPSEHSCLKAYRDGSFFGSEYGKDLRFTEIVLIDKSLRVKVSKMADIKIVTDLDESVIKNDQSLIFQIPFDSNGVPEIKYVRIEALDADGERILSQPIRFITT